MSISEICALRGMIGHLASINDGSKINDTLETLLSYDTYYGRCFSVMGGAPMPLDPRERLQERLCFLKSGITDLLHQAGQRIDSPFHADFQQMEQQWLSFVEEVRIEVAKELFSSKIIALNEKMTRVWYGALGIEEKDLYKREFASLRAQSLDYLTEIDPRGMIGWEKVDRTIQTIVELIHRNPHTYHFGESCSGHVHDTEGRYSLSNGYIQIGTDKSPDAARLIEVLEAISRELPNLSLRKEEENFEGASLRVGAFDHPNKNSFGGIDKDKCSREELLALEEKMKGVWQKVEEVLARHTAPYERVWDRERTALWKNSDE